MVSFSDDKSYFYYLFWWGHNCILVLCVTVSQYVFISALEKKKSSAGIDEGVSSGPNDLELSDSSQSFKTASSSSPKSSSLSSSSSSSSADDERKKVNKCDKKKKKKKKKNRKEKKRKKEKTMKKRTFVKRGKWALKIFIFRACNYKNTLTVWPFSKLI